MKDKLTYKLQNIILDSEYTEITIKNKLENRDVNIRDADIKFRYEPQNNKGYLNFGECNGSKLCEIEDKSINEVILNKDSLIIYKNEKVYSLFVSTIEINNDDRELLFIGDKVTEVYR